jgi:hypothetical protein
MRFLDFRVLTLVGYMAVKRVFFFREPRFFPFFSFSYYIAVKSVEGSHCHVMWPVREHQTRT